MKSGNAGKIFNIVVSAACSLTFIIWFAVGVPVDLWWVLVLLLAVAALTAWAASRTEKQQNQANDDDFVARLRADHDGQAQPNTPTAEPH